MIWKKIVVDPIRLYQKLREGLGLGSNCRFRPTCSEYSREAILKKGIIKGGWMSLKRIMRCHPWSRGGWNPVE